MVNQFIHRQVDYLQTNWSKLSLLQGITMKKIVSIITVSMLFSCGFMTTTKQYAGDRQGFNAIAVVQSYVKNPFADENHATITGYTKIEPSGVSDTKSSGCQVLLTTLAKLM
jgi:hypothetical protein